MNATHWNAGLYIVVASLGVTRRSLESRLSQIWVSVPLHFSLEVTCFSCTLSSSCDSLLLFLLFSSHRLELRTLPRPHSPLLYNISLWLTKLLWFIVRHQKSETKNSWFTAKDGILGDTCPTRQCHAAHDRQIKTIWKHQKQPSEGHWGFFEIFKQCLLVLTFWSRFMLQLSFTYKEVTRSVMGWYVSRNITSIIIKCSPHWYASRLAQ